MLSTFSRAAATWRPVPVDGRRGGFRTTELFANAFGLSSARTDQSAGNGQDTPIFVPKSPIKQLLWSRWQLCAAQGAHLLRAELAHALDAPRVKGVGAGQRAEGSRGERVEANGALVVISSGT